MSYTLLETVNYIISQTGAAPVTDINDPLPDVQSAKLRINEARIETLKKGLWFNTAHNQTITAVTNQFPVPANTMKVLKSAPMFLVPRDGFLYSPQQGTNVFPGVPTVTVDLVHELDYEDMPYTAQDVVRLSAARQHVLLELEDSAKADSLNQDLNLAVASLREEEVEVRRYNIEANPTLKAEEARKQLLSEGWWFNTEHALDIPLASSQFPVGADHLRVLRSSPVFVVPRGGFYYDTFANTATFTIPTLTVDVAVDLPFEDIPEEARAVIRAASLREQRTEELAMLQRSGDKTVIAQGTKRVETAEQDWAVAYKALQDADKTARYNNIDVAQTQRQDEERRKLLSDGWWFNTDYDVAFSVALVDGLWKYPADPDMFRVIGEEGDVIRNGVLYNTFTGTDTYNSGDPARVLDVVRDLPFDNIPVVAQDVIRLRAEREWAINEVGDMAKAEVLDKQLVEAMADLRKKDREYRYANMDAGLTPRQEEEKIRVLKRGWWFNTDYSYTVAPDGSNMYPVPTGTLAILKSTGKNFVNRDGFLYSPQDNTDTFPGLGPVTIDRVIDIDYPELPDAAKEVIRLRAEREWALNEDRDLERVQLLDVQVEEAEKALRAQDRDARYDNIELGTTPRQVEEKTKVLKKGWWFNTEFNVEVTKDGNDKYPVPSDVLKVLKCSSRGANLVPRDGFLYSMHGATDVFPEGDDTLTLDWVVNLEFTDLPESAKDVVRLRGQREWAMNMDRDLDKVQLLERQIREAEMLLGRDDVQLRKVGQINNPRLVKVRRGVRPYRRGRGVNPTVPGGN
jgi:hypothetical protein